MENLTNGAACTLVKGGGTNGETVGLAPRIFHFKKTHAM